MKNPETAHQSTLTHPEIEQPIIDYIKKENTDYALMLEGQWGCGKTYFLNNVLRNEIKDILKEKKLDWTYLSLFGVSSIDDFYVRLITNHKTKDSSDDSTETEKKQNLLSKKSISKPNISDAIIKFIDSKTGIKLNLSNLINHSYFAKRFIVIDDFERIGEGLSTNQVLGVINELTSRYHIKVLIIGYEEKTDDFKEFKEKGIRFTLKYSPVIRDVAKEIINKSNFDDVEKQHFEEIAKVIVTIFVEAGYSNIRTLKYIFDVYHKVFSILREYKHQKEIANKFVRFITLYSIEYKKGTSPKDLLLLQNLWHYFTVDLSQITLSDDNNSQTKENVDNYLESVAKTYPSCRENWTYYEELTELIENGYVDDSRLRGITTREEEVYARLEGTEEGNLLNKFKQYYCYSDTDFKNNLFALIKNIEGNKYNLTELFEITELLCRFHAYGIININSYNAALINAIRHREEIDKYNGIIHSELLSVKLDNMDSLTEGEPVINEYLREINKVNLRIFSKEQNNKYNMFLSCIRSREYSNIDDFIYQPENIHLILNHGYNEIKEMLTTEDSPIIHTLLVKLNTITRNIPININKQQCETLQEFNKWLADYTEQNKQRYIFIAASNLKNTLSQKLKDVGLYQKQAELH